MDGGCLVQVPKLLNNMVEIIKILERVKVDSPKKKLGGPSQQSGLSKNAF